VGFTDIAKACGSITEATGYKCDALLKKRRAYMNGTFKTDLVNLYDEIAKRAPNAQIIIVGYPQIYTKEESCDFQTSFKGLDPGPGIALPY
jgi:hypothetical protein